MSNNLTPLGIRTHTTHTTKTTIKLNGRQIIELLNGSITDEIPDNAVVTFSIPGGGDWSNQNLDFKDDSLVTISYSTTTQSKVS